MTTCPVCGGPDQTLLWAANQPPVLTPDEFSYTGNKRHHGRIVRCRACSHRFVDPAPADLPALYSQVVDTFYAGTEHARIRTFEEFLHRKEQHCDRHGSLLDVGCYIGTFLSVAARHGYDVEGIELSEWAADIARRRGHRVHKGSTALLPGLTRHYDAITAFDVMEHLTDPLAFAAAARERLTAGGCFVATVPDMGSWHARLFGRRHWLVVTMHVQYFTRATLDRLLAGAGFSRRTIVSAPPYRLRLADAAAYSGANAFLRAPFAIAKRMPALSRLELRLKASLFAIAWP